MTEEPNPDRVLVVDDEMRIRRFITRGLSAEGLRVEAVPSAREALSALQESDYDLIVLDLLMPETNGFDALGAILDRNPSQSVLILSCLDDSESKVVCLEQGAEDYLTKPFTFDELVARVHARLRASRRQRPGPLHNDTGTRLLVGGTSLDLVRRTIDLGNGPVPLAEREFHFLRELMERPGVVVAKERLLSRVWDYYFDPDSNVIDVCVWRLRAKLGPDVIRTIRGKGYAFDAH